jgi:hypothetical protein
LNINCVTCNNCNHAHYQKKKTCHCDTKSGLPYHAFAHIPRLYKICNHIAKEKKMHKKKHVTKMWESNNSYKKFINVCKLMAHATLTM